MTVSGKKSWNLVLLVVFAAYIGVTLLYLQPGPGTPHQPGTAPKPLLAVADGVQFLLTLAAGLLCFWQSLRFGGRARVFWILMGVGFCTWAISAGAWVYFEVVLGKPIPDPFWGDVVLFFHFVPYTAALIVRPHRPGEVRKIILPAIDWTMLLAWWLFLYVYLVFPWQFIRLNVAKYDEAFNVLYVSENLLWLGILLAMVLTVKNQWRKIYGLLLLGGGLYTLASQILDYAIRRGDYYSGSVYDIPLVLALLVFVWIAANASDFIQQDATKDTADAHEAEAFGPRLAMLALLSIPVIVTWTEMITPVRGDIYRFRVLASMMAMVVMGALVFVKQYLLDLDRLRLLRESRENYAELRHLQAQLIQNEKLESLGQLISGAAHEINNPLTAILGYSELMEYDAQSDETLKSHAAKIKQQVLRTKDIVRNLQRFAKRPSGEKKPLDLNTLVEQSIRARESETSNKSVRFLRELDPKLPPVLGDEAQLADVCLQLLGNAADILARRGGGEVTVKTGQERHWVILEVMDSGPGISEPARVFDPFYTTKNVGQGTGLGLSICYGIITDHKGYIFAENLPKGGARFVVRLPAVTSQNSADSESLKEHRD